MKEKDEGQTTDESSMLILVVYLLLSDRLRDEEDHSDSHSEIHDSSGQASVHWERAPVYETSE